MKKMSVFAVAAAVLAVLCGCTSVNSTQKFNAINLTDSSMKAVCVSHVQITGFYIFGLPTFVGSSHGDGKCTMFQYTGTAENVIHLLTKEVKSKGATRLVDVTVTETAEPCLLPCLTTRRMQASGVGVRPAGAAQNAAY